MAVPTRLNTASEVLAQLDSFGYDDGSDNKLGDLTEAGLSIQVATEEVSIKSGSQIEVYTFATGSTEQTMSGSLLNVNVNNVAFVLGMNDDSTNITGTGSAGDPYILAVSPELIGQQVARKYFAQGARVDGDIIRWSATTARIFAPDAEFSVAQGSPTELPFRLRITGDWEVRQWTP